MRCLLVQGGEPAPHFSGTGSPRDADAILADLHYGIHTL